MGKSWLSGRGHDGLAGEADAASTTGSLRRFWLKPRNATSIIFVSDHADGFPIRYHEHQVCIKGSWMNWATCPQDDGPCPLCDIGDEPSYVAAWPIIDRTEFRTKKGQTLKDQPRLFVAKSDVITTLTRKSEYFRTELNKKTGKPKSKGGLRGIQCQVARGDDKSPNTGSTFDNWTRADKNLVVEATKKMPDIEEVLRPNMLKLSRYARILTKQASGHTPSSDDLSDEGDSPDDVEWS